MLKLKTCWIEKKMLLKELYTKGEFKMDKLNKEELLTSFKNELNNIIEKHQDIVQTLKIECDFFVQGEFLNVYFLFDGFYLFCPRTMKINIHLSFFSIDSAKDDMNNFCFVIFNQILKKRDSDFMAHVLKKKGV